MTTNLRPLALAALFVTGGSAGDVFGQESIMQFDGGLAVSGSAAASFFNGATTSGSATFGLVSSFAGLPALPGGDATVLRLPSLTANQGVVFQTNAAANGGGTRINQYTFGYDILMAAEGTGGFSVFHNITAGVPGGTATDDGEFFRRNDGGVGISGQYAGAMNLNTWHRVMGVVDVGAGTFRKYIDGTLAAEQTIDNTVDGRFSVDPAAPGTNGLVLFNDEDGESGQVFVNSFYFNNTLLTDAQITVYAGPTIAGFTPVPEPVTTLAAAAGGLGLAGAVRRVRRRAVTAPA